MNLKFNKISVFIIYLTSILTFFLLWVSSSDKVDDLYVKNILKKDLVENFSLKEDVINKIVNREDLDLDKFWQVYFLIKNDFYSSWAIKKQDLVDWAISGLVSSLWDKHSEYMSAEETKKFNDVLNWDFEWIWAVVETNPIWVVIDRVLKGSPASKFWLKAWDILVKANWEELKDLSLYDAVDKIKWPAGTEVLLTVLRDWENDFLEIKVIRDKIKIPSVEYKALESEDFWEFWYISLNMFWTDTAEEFKKALIEDKEKNTKWLIIDLRDNWGWYLNSAVEILSNFIGKDKDIVITKYKNSFKNFSYKSYNDWELIDKKLVILINENSASASEITAWALRDYDKAILVWKKTYWKWSVQEPLDFVDGSSVKLTIAKWYTPKDKNIDWAWVMPDVEVDFEKQDYNADACVESWKCKTKEDFEPYDRQLEIAKDVLKDFVNLGSIGLTIDKYNKKEEN